MNIELSDEFQKLASKIYTFAIIFIAVTFLKIKTISQVGVKIEIENTNLLSGGVAIVTFCLTIAAALCLVRDYVITKVVEDSVFDEATVELKANIKEKRRSEQSFIEKHFYFYLFAAWTSFFIEGILPVVVGGWVTWFGFDNMIKLIYTSNS